MKRHWNVNIRAAIHVTDYSPLIPVRLTLIPAACCQKQCRDLAIVLIATVSLTDGEGVNPTPADSIYPSYERTPQPGETVI